MNAPLNHHAGHGSQDMLREFIAEHLGVAQIYVAHAFDCASVGDDFGLACALRKHGLLMNAVHETYRDLAAKKEEGAHVRSS